MTKQTNLNLLEEKMFEAIEAAIRYVNWEGCPEIYDKLKEAFNFAYAKKIGKVYPPKPKRKKVLKHD